MYVTDSITHGTVTPTYPVIQYGHTPSGGDAIAGGFVYRGTRIPELHGKYIFGDTSTGRMWCADFNEMVEAERRGGLSKASRQRRTARTSPPPVPCCRTSANRSRRH